MRRHTPHAPWTLCLALVAALSVPAMAADHSQPGHLQASGTGEVVLAPSEATITARLWEQTAFAKADAKHPDELKPDAMFKARQKVLARASKVILALEGMDIASRHIDAGSLHIGHTQTHDRLANGTHQRMIAIRVERPIKITLHDLEQVPAVLDILTGQGVNHLGGVDYRIRDMEAAHREALAMAIDHARLEAEVMAAGLDLDIGRVVSVSRGNKPNVAPNQPYTSMRESHMASAGQAPEYRPGEITVTAQANVTWEVTAK
ncbi:SIMPL domain-containing protein [Vreelandella rituensis]|uniref:DUF541 domain-containing protein n=1 Tax=Vreelandella rituensis TaxID=2282306 RepID=A0A368U9R7_9GAMM|nr:SIMPL domain-containing protein [Halomonas rituensis]RCV93684.1 DUF541 domain-containing protein [Halomonas rituensis]